MKKALERSYSERRIRNELSKLGFKDRDKRISNKKVYGINCNTLPSVAFDIEILREVSRIFEFNILKNVDIMFPRHIV